MPSQTCTKCGFVASGESNEEVRRKMEEHARKAHGQTMQDVPTDAPSMRGTPGA